MKLPIRGISLLNASLALLLLFSSSVVAEIISQKRLEPFERESCRLCHKGPSKHQIDDSRDPWCVPCHRQHGVGTDLGLQSYATQRLRTTHQSQRPEQEASIIAQEMVLIPGGVFMMGADFTKKSLGPSHEVDLPPFYIDKYHVTNGHYQAFVQDTNWRRPSHWFNGSYPRGKANHPVAFVSWSDAVAFCRWSGKRLPSEAEWEKAARGTDGRMFPWGKQFLKAHANVYLEEVRDTTPVDAYPDGISPYGLYDMAGNLFQWTSDWFLPYPGNTVPHPNFGETLKVLRGGSFYDCSNYRCGISFQTFNRISLLPQTRAISAGFRCAKSAEPEKK